MKRLIAILSAILASQVYVAAQYSSDAFDLKKAADLYDERGYLKSKSLSVDGNLAVSEGSGNLTYTYPLAETRFSGRSIRTTLNYCSSVPFSTYVQYSASNFNSPYEAWAQFSQNRPTWIIGVNEFAVQVLSFARHFHTDPAKLFNLVDETSPQTSFTDKDFVWTVDGYDVCNRMAKLLPDQNARVVDVIRLLRADGSVLTLRKESAESDPEASKCTGVYAAFEANPHGYGLVEFDSLLYPEHLRVLNHTDAHIPRILRYFPGDGLQYVFREYVIPFGRHVYADSMAIYGGMNAGPTVFYLEEIWDNSGFLGTVSRRGHLGSDIARGRANATWAGGASIEFGRRGFTIEADGRTYSVRMKAGVFSGSADTNQHLPFYDLGDLTSATTTTANECESADDYASYVAQVARIIDPAGRETTFEYEPYVRRYSGFNFPRTGTTMRLGNHRLTRVTEPLQRYDICYYNSNLAAGTECGSDAWDTSAIEPLGMDPRKLNNWVREVRKFDREGNRLTTARYAYDTEFGQGQGDPVTSIMVTDDRDGTVRKSRRTYHQRGLGSLVPMSPPAVFTELSASVDSTGSDEFKTVSWFGQLGTGSYFVKPTRVETLVNDVLKSRTEFHYDAEIVRHFGGTVALDSALGLEVWRESRAEFAGTTLLTRDTIELVNFPLHDSIAVEYVTRLDKHATYFRYDSLTKAGHPAVVGREYHEVMLLEPVVVWHHDTLLDRRCVDPPAYGLVTRSRRYDRDGMLLTGTGRGLYSGIASTYNANYRGNLLSDSALGYGGIHVCVNSHEYSGRQYGLPENNLIRSRNALGATTELAYSAYQRDVKRPGGTDTAIAFGHQGEILKNSDVRDTVERPRTLEMFRAYNVPSMVERHVRRFRTDGTLDTVRLRTVYGLTYHGLYGEEIGPNGQLVRTAYDGAGRMRHAWLPQDFPPALWEVDSLPYEGWFDMGLYAWSEHLRRADVVYCTPQGSSVQAGSDVSTIVAGTLRAGVPGNAVPACRCDSSSVAEKDRAHLERTCYETLPHDHYEPYEQSLHGWTGHLTHRLSSANPLDMLASAQTIDSAWLRLFVTGTVGECITLEVDIPQFQFRRYFVFDCGPYGDCLPAPPTEKAAGPRLQTDTTSVEDGYFLRVDLTPIRDDLLALGNGNELDIVLRVFSSGHVMNFASGLDAEDKRPLLQLKGEFLRRPDTSDYTLANEFNDTERRVTSRAKVDDIRHTTSLYQLGPTQTDLRRSETVRVLTQGGLVGRSDATIGNLLDPERIDSVLFAYNGRGQTVRTTNQLGDTSVVRHDAQGRPVEKINADGTRSTIAYQVGLPSTVVPLQGQDFYGLASAEIATNEIGIVSARYLDARDQLRLEIVDTAGLKLATRYEYDVLGRLTSVVSPSGDTTRYWYDAFGRIRYKYQPDIDTLSYACDVLGNVRFSQTQQQANDTLVTFTQYDDLNRVTVVGEAKLPGPPPPAPPPHAMPEKGGGARLAGDSVELRDFGRWTDRLDPNVLHDGGLSGILTANVTLVSGGAAGVPGVWMYNQRSHVDPACWLEPSAELEEPTSPMPPYLAHPVTYPDPIVNPPASPALFEHAALFPHFLRIVVAYDTLPARTGPVWTNLPPLDEWQALTPHGQIRNSKGREVAVAYREHGGMPFYFTMLSYDERGRVEALLRYTDNVGYDAVYYTYNATNQVTSVRVVDPLNQHATWYGYDHNGRVDTVWSLLLRGTGFGAGPPVYPAAIPIPRNNPDAVMSYTRTNQLDSVVYPPVLGTVRYWFNRRGWMDSLVAWGTNGFQPEFLFRQVLLYDSSGRIIKQRWQHRYGSQQSQTYAYDNASRLTSWAVPGGTTSYTYDEVGNRLHAGHLTSDTYLYNQQNGPNRLQQVTRIGANTHTVTGYAYDADGAVTGRSVTTLVPPPTATASETFAYSFRDLLWRYESPMGADWRYRYSASGEREQKRRYPADTNEHGSQNRSPWVYYVLGGGKEQLAVWHGQEIWDMQCPELPFANVAMYPVEYNSYMGGLARVSTTLTPLDPLSGWKLFHIPDHLGSVRVSLDAQGNLTQLDYEPFGAVASVTQLGTHIPRQTFIDKEKDPESALADFGVRKYEAETGRFLSVDALWERYRGANPYHYALNSPITHADPTGLGVNGAHFVVNRSTSDVVLVGDGEIVDTDADGSKRRQSGRSTVVLKPGDRFDPLIVSAPQEDGGVINIYAGTVTRKDGSTEIVPIYDVDGIVVQTAQVLYVDGRPVTEMSPRVAADLPAQIKIQNAIGSYGLGVTGGGVIINSCNVVCTAGVTYWNRPSLITAPRSK